MFAYSMYVLSTLTHSPLNIFNKLHNIHNLFLNIILGDKRLILGEIPFNYQHPVVLSEQMHHFHVLSITFR